METSLHFKLSLNGTKIPTIAGTGGVQIPLLSPNSPIKHYESWNWKSFSSLVSCYKVDHPDMFPEAIVFCCLAQCELMLKKPHPDVRSLSWILMC